MTDKEKLAELHAIRGMIETEVFQKYFVKPIKKEVKKVAVTFFAEDLKENWRSGGRFEGLNVFIDILKEIDNDYRNTRTDLESHAE